MARLLMVLLFFVALLFGGLWLSERPEQLPQMTFRTAAGAVVDFDDLRGTNEYLLLVFVLPRCPISKYSVTQVTQIARLYSSRLSVAGLFFGSSSGAAKYRSQNMLSLRLVGLKDSPDPLAVKDLYETVGFSRGTRKAIYGGTVLLLDSENYALFSLEKDEIRELTGRLADLGI